MRSKKALWIVLAVAVIAIVAVFALGGEEDKLFATPATVPIDAREGTYQAYLDKHGYADTLAQARIDVDMQAWEASDDMEAENGQEGVLTGDSGTITWNFEAQESGFYNLEIGYIALPGTTSDIQRRVLLDGEAPYTALTQIVFKRIWRDENIRLKN